MPMGIAFETPLGRRDVLLAKLHHSRCLLDPAAAHVSRTARRESRKYALSFNRCFDEVLASCVARHGPDWLVPDLVDSFSALHAGRAGRKAAFVSVELWLTRDGGPVLAAGEIGYRIGGAYASLTGYTDVSGAGTVQLAALGRALARSGIRVWDLGMKIDYKTGLGALALPRSEFMPVLARAYADAPARAGLDMLADTGFIPARDLIKSGTVPVA
jgi:leucyl/phenylalanyl-tRNA--protein transferase